MEELVLAAREREAPRAVELVSRARMLATGTQSRPLNASSSPLICSTPHMHPSASTHNNAMHIFLTCKSLLSLHQKIIIIQTTSGRIR